MRTSIQITDKTRERLRESIEHYGKNETNDQIVNRLLNVEQSVIMLSKHW